MLAIKQLKLLWNGRINLDEQTELLKDTKLKFQKFIIIYKEQVVWAALMGIISMTRKKNWNF